MVPLIEIYFLIQVGGTIGAAWTIFFVVGTALVGAFLVKAQGFATLTRIRAQLERDELPTIEVFEGFFLLLAGALLLTPGFFTDALGFAFLTPPLRRGLVRYVLKRGVWGGGPHGPGPGPGRGPEPGGRPPIEGDFDRLD
ncbi:MAG: FxsA family protein [Gammaproteobacteria bacterium]|nr:FxsA family protein [Gammaproteobacteria bacterium]